MVSILVCVCILAVAGIFIYKEMQSQKAMQISAGNSHNVGSGFRNITYNGEKYEYNNRITTILYAGVDSEKAAIDEFSNSNEKNKLEKLLVDLGVDTTKPVPTDNGGTASPIYYEPATPGS